MGSNKNPAYEQEDRALLTWSRIHRQRPEGISRSSRGFAGTDRTGGDPLAPGHKSVSPRPSSPHSTESTGCRRKHINQKCFDAYSGQVASVWWAWQSLQHTR